MNILKGDKMENKIRYSDLVRDLPLSEKIRRSRAVIKKAVEKSTHPLIINFSGGKDSLVCLSLCKSVTRKVEACYCDGGIDLPLTKPYVIQTCKDLGIKLHIPTVGVDLVPHRPNSKLSNCQTLVDYIRHYGYFPTAGKRWCSIWIKQRVIKAYFRKIYGRDILYKVNGVRMFESKTRLWKYGDQKHFKKYSLDGTPFFRKDGEAAPHICVYPIVEWTDENVTEYLNMMGIKIHGGYKEAGVSGCKWCPVHPLEVYRALMTKYPTMYDEFIKLENEINRPAIQGKLWLRDLKKELYPNRK